MNELVYLAGTDERDELVKILNKYWGLETIANLNRDDSFRIASCMARVSDFLDITGKDIEQLADEREKAAKSSNSMGFGRHG